MIDCLEELLALMEIEDEDGEREDALALTAGTAVPAPPGPEMETGEQLENVRVETADAPDMEKQVRAALETSDGVRSAQKALTEAWENDVPEANAPAEVGGAEAENAAGQLLEELWKDPRLPPAIHQNGVGTAETPGVGAVGSVGAAGVAKTEDTAAEPAAAAEAGAGLERLYRQTVQASHPVAQTLGAERTLRAAEPGRSAALTVDELDRAVRRDSRRYDGGMMIF